MEPLTFDNRGASIPHLRSCSESELPTPMHSLASKANVRDQDVMLTSVVGRDVNNNPIAFPALLREHRHGRRIHRNHSHVASLDLKMIPASKKLRERVVSTSRSLRQITSASHTVFNQSTPFVNVDLFKSDRALADGLKSLGNKYKLNVNTAMVAEFGAKSGAEELMTAGDLAEKNRPVLRQFDNYGRRIDVAEYHPAYHQLMNHGLSQGCAAHGFRVNQPGAQLTRCAIMYMENQVEAGHCCPITMTAAVIPVLQRSADQVPFAKALLDKILAQGYDPRNAPIEEKNGVTMGMSMTEKQGGSDVRSNTTLATAIDPNKKGLGAPYHLVGHKVRSLLIVATLWLLTTLNMFRLFVNEFSGLLLRQCVMPS